MRGEQFGWGPAGLTVLATTAALALLGPSGLSACASRTEAPHFALTSARILQPKHTEFPATLALAAGPHTRSLDSYAGIRIDGVAVFDADAAPLSRGETRSGVSIASILAPIPVGTEPFEFDEIVVMWDDRTETTHPVGQWRFEPTQEHTEADAVNDWPAAIGDCESLTVPLPSTADGAAQGTVHVDQPGVHLGARSGIFSAPSGGTDLVLDLRCSDRFDFSVVTASHSAQPAEPAAPGEPPAAAPGAAEHPFDPILVGYLDVSDADVARILGRAGNS